MNQEQQRAHFHSLVSTFNVAGTPSFGYQAMFLIDPKVMEREIVFTGGGSQTSLVKIRTKELVRANQGSILHIRQ